MMLLQAASMGTPLIYSDIPENLSVLKDIGPIFKVGDVGDLSEKLRFAWNNPAEMRSRAEAAQNQVKTAHSWENIVRQYESLYAV